MPAVEGAVYKPALETVPPVALHATLVFELPVTLAVNCCMEPDCKEAVVGFTATATVGAPTVIDAVADLLVSATLVAVMV